MLRHSMLDAEAAFEEAVAGVGLLVEVGAGPQQGGDLILVNPTGGRIEIDLRRLSLASADGMARRIEEWNRQPRRRTGAVGVIVADRVTRDARELLRDAGWGWLDLRGHLHIAGPGLFVDSDVERMTAAAGPSAPLAGRVGIEVAAAVLLRCTEPARVRRIASELGRAPSSVSQTLTSMRAAGLLDEARRPVIPELFWQLAERWTAPAHDIQTLPSPGGGATDRALNFGVEDVEHTTGWVLGDTVAAARLGAPVSIRSDHPPDFYVPDEATLRRARHLLGPTPDHATRAATIRVAPVPLVCSLRVDGTERGSHEWPLAQPLFVALDLAQDPVRGREILDGWTPPRRWRRVW